MLFVNNFKMVFLRLSFFGVYLHRKYRRFNALVARKGLCRMKCSNIIVKQTELIFDEEKNDDSRAAMRGIDGNCCAS